MPRLIPLAASSRAYREENCKKQNESMRDLPCRSHRHLQFFCGLVILSIQLKRPVPLFSHKTRRGAAHVWKAPRQQFGRIYDSDSAGHIPSSRTPICGS